MSKILSILVAAVFAVSTGSVFAASHTKAPGGEKKEEMKKDAKPAGKKADAKPAAAAPAKKEEMKKDAKPSAPAKAAPAKKEEKKEEKKDAKKDAKK